MKENTRSSISQFASRHRKGLLLALAVLLIVSAVGAVASSFGGHNEAATFAKYGTGLLPVTDAAATDGIADDKSGSGSTTTTGTQPWDRMVIRTATIQLTVKDAAAGVDRLRSLASQHGGYVSSSDTSQQGDYSYSTVTIQVPSQDFDQVIPLIERMDGMVVKVLDENITSSDVTEEYTDLQSQLRNLQATEARMLALQAKAEQMDDILAIDRELRDIQGQIETIQGRVNYLSKRSEMSTITITLYPESAPIATEPAWQPLRTAETAWNDSLDMLASLSTGLIRFAVFLWWLVPLVLLGAFVLRRARRPSLPLPTTTIDAPTA
jgi:hypothetical protein